MKCEGSVYGLRFEKNKKVYSFLAEKLIQLVQPYLQINDDDMLICDMWYVDSAIICSY